MFSSLSWEQKFCGAIVASMKIRSRLNENLRCNSPHIICPSYNLQPQSDKLQVVVCNLQTSLISSSGSVNTNISEQGSGLDLLNYLGLGDRQNDGWMDGFAFKISTKYLLVDK